MADPLAYPWDDPRHAEGCAVASSVRGRCDCGLARTPGRREALLAAAAGRCETGGNCPTSGDPDQEDRWCPSCLAQYILASETPET